MDDKTAVVKKKRVYKPRTKKVKTLDETAAPPMKKPRRIVRPKKSFTPAPVPMPPKAFTTPSKPAYQKWEPPTSAQCRTDPTVSGPGCKCYSDPITKPPWVRVCDLDSIVAYKMPPDWADGGYFRGCDSGSRGLAHIFNAKTKKKYDFAIAEFDRLGEGSYVEWDYCTVHKVFENKRVVKKLPMAPIEVMDCTH
jgi:hypothetical protein